MLDRILQAVRRYRSAQRFVDGANAAAIGLIAAVTLQLGKAAIVDPLTAALAAITVAIVFRWPFASVLMLLGGAIVTLVAHGPR